MKIRTGFVSNSSSSSFVLLTTKEHYTKCFEKMTEAEKEVLEAMSVKQNKKVFDKDLVCFTGSMGNFDNLDGFCFSDEIEVDEEDCVKGKDAYDIREKLLKKLQEGKNSFYTEIDS